MITNKNNTAKKSTNQAQVKNDIADFFRKHNPNHPLCYVSDNVYYPTNQLSENSIDTTLSHDTIQIVKKKPGDKGYRRTRQELIDATPEENRLIYDRRSRRSRLRRSQRQFKGQPLFISKSKYEKLFFPSSVPVDKKQVPSNVSLFIYISPSNITKSVNRLTTKKIVSSKMPITQIWGDQPGVIPSINESVGKKLDLLGPIAAKGKWHYQKQTLKLMHAYPMRIVQYAVNDFQGALAEKSVIRSSYRYIKKVMDNAMQREGLTPQWRSWYKKLEELKVYRKEGARIMNFDRDSQPSYGQPKAQKEEVRISSNDAVARTNKLLESYQRKPEEKQKAFATMTSCVETEEFKRFVALVGLETARKLFKTVYENTTKVDPP